MEKIFQSVFTCDNYVGSNAAQSLVVNGWRGTASVLFNDGSLYCYKNVSRRAIVLFILDDARSLGKFVNKVLKQERVKGNKLAIENTFSSN